jgi:hypothetical protein
MVRALPGGVEHLSPHGLLFVGLQVLVVVALAIVVARRHRAHGGRPHGFVALLCLLFVAWYGLLRVQPFRMGGDPFAYTLGIFDGVSIMGIVLLLILHWALLASGQAPEAPGKTL